MRSFKFLFVILLLFSVAFFFGAFFITDVSRYIVEFVKGSILTAFGLAALLTGLTGMMGGAISNIETWEDSLDSKPKIFWVSLSVVSIQVVLIWLFLFLEISKGGACWEMSGCSLMAALAGLLLAGPGISSLYYLRMKKWNKARF